MRLYQKILFASACITVAGAAGVRAQSVTLRPVDTGQSAVTFNLGGDQKSMKPARFQLKTNLLWAGATQTPNLAFEFGLSSRTSIEVSGGYNAWGNLWDYGATGEPFDIENLYKRKLDHTFAKVEYRYWLKERFKGHFFGAGAFGADYRVGELDLPLLFEKEHEYDGFAYGGSLTYGWLWRMTPVVAMEFSISGGAAFFKYDRGRIQAGSQGYELIEVDRYKKTYIGPTGAGIKLVFTIK
jgi:hypothetical protein